jgi:hypothetical protein
LSRPNDPTGELCAVPTKSWVFVFLVPSAKGLTTLAWKSVARRLRTCLTSGGTCEVEAVVWDLDDVALRTGQSPLESEHPTVHSGMLGHSHGVVMPKGEEEQHEMPVH